MRSIIGTSLLPLLAIIIPSDFASANSIDRLIAKWGILNDECQSGSGENPDTLRACEERGRLDLQLERQGYTYGCDGDLGYQTYWRNDCSQNTDSYKANPDYTEQLKSNDFSCRDTSSFATQLLAESTLGLIKVIESGVATLESDDNQLICKLVIQIETMGFRQKESLTYTVTVLDNGDLWVEFLGEQVGNSNRAPIWRLDAMPIIPNYQPLPRVNTYTHSAQPRREYP